MPLIAPGIPETKRGAQGRYQQQKMCTAAGKHLLYANDQVDHHQYLFGISVGRNHCVTPAGGARCAEIKDSIVPKVYSTTCSFSLAVEYNAIHVATVDLQLYGKRCSTAVPVHVHVPSGTY